ncbi:hypothetical protein D3C78_560870 [compost metagenome]
MIAPAIVVRVVPVVVAALLDQAHLEVVGRQFLAFRVGHQQFEFDRPVAAGLFAIEQGTQPRHAVRRPYRLHHAPGNRPATGLLQAGLDDQLQRRLDLGPLAVQGDQDFAVFIQGGFFQLQVLAQLLFGDRAELIAGQALDRFTQRPHVHLTAQAIACGGGAVQVTTTDRDFGGIGGLDRYIAALEFQGQALGQEVFHQELVELRFAVTQVEHQLPAPGRCFSGQLQLILIEAGRIGIPDKLAADLLIRAPHFNADRLRLDRVAVLISQQGIEQYGFAGTVEVTRAKHEKLQRVGLRSGNVEFGQVQRRAIESQQTGLFALMGQQHFGLFRQRQLGMAALPGLALGNDPAIGVEQLQADAIEGLAAIQRLGEHVQAILVTVHRQANVTEGEQSGRLRIVVRTGGTHHRQIDAWLLQRLEAGNRQQ